MDGVVVDVERVDRSGYGGSGMLQRYGYIYWEVRI